MDSKMYNTVLAPFDHLRMSAVTFLHRPVRLGLQHKQSVRLHTEPRVLEAGSGRVAPLNVPLILVADDP